MRRKQVLVQLLVDVDARVPIAEVRQHIAREAHASKGQFTDRAVCDYDWRGDISVALVRNIYPKTLRERRIATKSK